MYIIMFCSSSLLTDFEKLHRANVINIHTYVLIYRLESVIFVMILVFKKDLYTLYIKPVQGMRRY